MPVLDHIASKREREHRAECTCKLGCHAHIEIYEYRLYSEYGISLMEIELLKNKQLRQLREAKLHALKQALKEGKPVRFSSKFFVLLPTHEAREKFHPTGIVSGSTQKMHFKKTWYEKAQQTRLKFRER